MIYQEPRIVERVTVQREPVYLHVPLAMPNTGVNIAPSTTRASNPFTPCKTAGMKANMCHVIKQDAMKVMTTAAKSATRVIARTMVNTMETNMIMVKIKV